MTIVQFSDISEKLIRLKSLNFIHARSGQALIHGQQGILLEDI